MPAISRTTGRAAALPIALAAVLALSSTALAGWTTASNLRPAVNSPWIADLSGSGAEMAAIWGEDPGEVWARTSSDAGTNFGGPQRLSALGQGAWSASVTSDMGSGAHYATWAESGPSNQGVFMAEKPFGNPLWGSAAQLPTPGCGSCYAPSIAATQAYVFVVYMREVNSIASKAFLQIYDRQLATWRTTPITLGYAVRARVAASGTKVLIAWQDMNDNIKIRRGAFGAGASPTITWSSTTLATGENPIIVLSGPKAFVAWTRNYDLYAARSSSSGSSWTQLGKLLNGALHSYYRLYDVGSYYGNVTITGVENGDESSGNLYHGNGFRLQTTSLGSSWTKTISHPTSYDDRQVAYTAAPGSGFPVAGEAWKDVGAGGTNKLKFHRQT